MNHLYKLKILLYLMISLWKPVPKSKSPRKIILHPSNKLKSLNWKQAKKRFPKMNPYGDRDHDGVINKFDCRPFDRTRQDEDEDDRRFRAMKKIRKLDPDATFDPGEDSEDLEKSFAAMKAEREEE